MWHILKKRWHETDYGGLIRAKVIGGIGLEIRLHGFMSWKKGQTETKKGMGGSYSKESQRIMGKLKEDRGGWIENGEVGSVSV